MPLLLSGCRCYFLDAADLKRRIPQLTSSLWYSVLFKSPDGQFELESGKFGLVMQGTSVTGLRPVPASPTSPTATATPTNVADARNAAAGDSSGSLLLVTVFASLLASMV